MDENDIAELQMELENLGYDYWVANALAERGKTPADLDHMSEKDILTEVLEWHGIIGYANRIVSALDNIRDLKKGTN